MHVARLLLLAATLTMGAAACGGDDSEPEPVSPLRGVIVELDVAGDGDLNAFDVRDDDGDTWSFGFQPDPGAEVPVQHLQLHRDQSWAVLVHFKGNGDDRVATRIDDAEPAPSPSPP
jgi:hypothetical protein